MILRLFLVTLIFTCFQIKELRACEPNDQDKKYPSPTLKSQELSSHASSPAAPASAAVPAAAAAGLSPEAENSRLSSERRSGAAVGGAAAAVRDDNRVHSAPAAGAGAGAVAPEAGQLVLLRVQHKATEFDAFIDTALREKYTLVNFPALMIDHQVQMFKTWSLSAFFEKYVSPSNAGYPLDRLEQLCAKLKDIQLQFYYIKEVDLGLYNRELYDKGFDPKAPNKSPFLHLKKLSFDQNLIVKSRILWEKIMNFVYFLEMGEDLEAKKKSKKGAFFDFTKKNEKWKFLAAYEAMLTRHDDKYRTPEVHKGSTLKKELTNPTLDQNDLLKAVNYAQNNIWEGILLIISGKKVQYFTDAHQETIAAADAASAALVDSGANDDKKASLNKEKDSAAAQAAAAHGSKPKKDPLDKKKKSSRSQATAAPAALAMSTFATPNPKPITAVQNPLAPLPPAAAGGAAAASDPST